MAKAEIQKQINKLSKEITNLESSKKSYQNMNTRINDAISKLTIAKDYAKKSYTLLEKYYQRSNTSLQKVSELKNEYINISNVISDLKSEILVASNNKINSINSKINDKKRKKRILRNSVDI